MLCLENGISRIKQSSDNKAHFFYPDLFPREGYLLGKTVFGSATGFQPQVVDLQEAYT